MTFGKLGPAGCKHVAPKRKKPVKANKTAVTQSSAGARRAEKYQACGLGKSTALMAVLGMWPLRPLPPEEKGAVASSNSFPPFMLACISFFNISRGIRKLYILTAQCSSCRLDSVPVVSAFLFWRVFLHGKAFGTVNSGIDLDPVTTNHGNMWYESEIRRVLLKSERDEIHIVIGRLQLHCLPFCKAPYVVLHEPRLVVLYITISFTLSSHFFHVCLSLPLCLVCPPFVDLWRLC